MVQTKKVPMRMCLSCREMKPKRELIRIVRSPEGNIFVDDTSKASGRGAYLCASADCFKKCVKSKAISREFECPVSDELLEQVQRRIDERN